MNSTRVNCNKTMFITSDKRIFLLFDRDKKNIIIK